MKKLMLENLISTGRTRLIYEHPEDKTLLVKVPRFHASCDDQKRDTSAQTLLKAISRTPSSENQRDLEAYKKTKVVLSEYLPEYNESLVETNCGKGVVAQKIMDSSGQLSKSLRTHLLTDKTVDASLPREFYTFFQLLITHQLYFYDFNTKNFIIQKNADHSKLFFIDLKGYRRDRTLIPLTRFSNRLAKAKMMRRIRGFYKKLLKQTPPF